LGSGWPRLSGAERSGGGVAAVGCSDREAGAGVVKPRPYTEGQRARAFGVCPERDYGVRVDD